MKDLKSELKIPDSVPMESVRAFAYYEFLTRFIMPLCTRVPGRPNKERAVTKTLCIVDISGISLKQVWSLRGWIQDLAKMFATNYPEILSRVFVRFPNILASLVSADMESRRSLVHPHTSLPSGAG